MENALGFSSKIFQKPERTRTNLFPPELIKVIKVIAETFSVSGILVGTKFAYLGYGRRSVSRLVRSE
ncbi:hypothetical protein [Haematobacter sp.]|uniref:hypothetical protein n=1 Tax=Haematobacter sp. TaxID=2953762 RepID=UPI0028AE463A|nr:hypothetical protein [Haematobacter sp.]